MKAFVYHIQVNVRDAAVSLPFYRDLLVHDDARAAGYSDGRTSIWLIETAGGHAAPGFHRTRAGLNHVDRFTRDFVPRELAPLYERPREFPEYRPPGGR